MRQVEHHSSTCRKGGVSTKGLVERRIALTKYAMLKLEASLRKEGITLSHSEICMEVCVAQNMLLEYNGGTPQMALTSQTQRGWHTPDSETVESITGALFASTGLHRDHA